MRRFVWALALATLLIAAGWGLLRVASSSASGSPRVLLIGIDGLDPDIVRGLVAQHRLPTFARLIREGAFGRLRSVEPILSPLVWTTIATGRKPADHGILDFVELDGEGRVVPITSARRRVAAVWNALGAFGVPSGFVGWYASYPAERVDGFVVSDRLAFHQVRSARAREHATFPESLAGELRRRFGDPAPDIARTRARFLADASAALSEDGARRVSELARSYATAEYYRRMLPFLQARYRPRVLGSYFELVDACGHLFMEDAPPRREGVSDGDYRAFAGTVDRCYEYQDEVLADLLKLEGADTVTIICSDHGFKHGEQRPETSGRADTGLAPLWHRLHGTLLLHGKAVVAGKAITRASVLDIAPTVLGLAGVPLSRELPGELLRQGFTSGTFPSPERQVASYARPPGARAGGSDAADADRLDRLRALGYLGAPTAGTAHDEEGRTAASYMNEGSALAADNQLERALQAYTKAIELDARNVNARVFAARICVHRRDMDRARRLIDDALALDPRNSAALLQRANWALRTGQLGVAAASLQAAARVDDRLPNLHLLQARLADATGHPEDALAALTRAEALTDADPLLAEILLFRAQVATSMGRLSEAEAALVRAGPVASAAALAPAQGDIALARRDFAHAVTCFRDATRQYPEDSVLLRKLGESLGATEAYGDAESAFEAAIEHASTTDEREGAYGDLSLLFQKQGRDDRALATLEAAVRAMPNSASMWGMLGAARGRAGQLGPALAAYERSVRIKPTALACKTLAALVFSERRDRARAAALWRESLALEPNQPDVRHFLQLYGRDGSRTR